MRSYRTSAVILALLMLLLVLAAGFVFLFQAQTQLRDQVRDSLAAAEDARATQAAYERELLDAEATRDAEAVARATAEHSILLLDGQLVDSQQELDQVSAEVDQMTATVSALETQIAEMEAEQAARRPQVAIIGPEEGDQLPIETNVDIQIVASDPIGLSSLTVAIDGVDLSAFSIDGDTFVNRTARWETPEEEGEHEITVTAENLNGVLSETSSVTVEISDIEGRNAALRAAVEASVIQLRGLQPLEPIEPVVLDRDALRERIEANFDEDNDPEETRQDVLSLSAFDLLPRDYDLYSALVNVYGEGVLGFYDPETAEFVVVSEDALLDPASQWTHAHEFVHALQDQHYNLDRISDDSLDSEARAAIRALGEGEAELVQYLFLFEGDYFTAEEIEEILTAPEQSDDSFLDELPPILINDLIFPYDAGTEFAITLYRDGGFTALDAAWRNPPLSTEHILHPERYLSGDTPQIVALAPLTATLGIGWEEIDNDILGEFYLREYLSQQLSEQAVDRAATGWGGDRYAVYWNEVDDELVMALHLVWDTEDDAAEFAGAFPDYPAGLFGVTGTVQPNGETCWVATETICLSAEDTSSYVVRAPNLATAAAVLTAIR